MNDHVQQRRAMDLRELSEAMDMDVEAYVEALTQFHKTALASLSGVESALETGSGSHVAESARSIEGAALEVGLENIVKIAREIAAYGRENKLDGIEKAILSLKEKIGTIGDFIARRS